MSGLSWLKSTDLLIRVKKVATGHKVAWLPDQHATGHVVDLFTSAKHLSH